MISQARDPAKKTSINHYDWLDAAQETSLIEEEIAELNEPPLETSEISMIIDDSYHV